MCFGEDEFLKECLQADITKRKKPQKSPETNKRKSRKKSALVGGFGRNSTKQHIRANSQTDVKELSNLDIRSANLKEKSTHLSKKDNEMDNSELGLFK